MIKKRCPICYKQIRVTKNRLRDHEFAQSGLLCGGGQHYVGDLFFFGNKLKRKSGEDRRFLFFRNVKVNTLNCYARFSINDHETYVGCQSTTPEKALKRLERDTRTMIRSLGLHFFFED